MFLKIAVVVVLLVILFSLGSGLVFLVQDKGRSHRTVKALTVRIALSLGLFILLMLAYAFGLIAPQPQVMGVDVAGLFEVIVDTAIQANLLGQDGKKFVPDGLLADHDEFDRPAVHGRRGILGRRDDLPDLLLAHRISLILPHRAPFQDSLDNHIFFINRLSR
jgi:hypothetical protein